MTTRAFDDSRARVHLSVSAARRLAEEALLGIGCRPEEAAIITDHVVDAALCGYEYAGLPKLLNLAESPRFRQPRSEMRITRETSVSLLLDGGNQNGMLGMHRATRAAIERASQHGVAVVAVHNIWMSGRSAYYVEMAASAGLIAIHTVAAPPVVAPPGGVAPALGTNPIAFGFPTDGTPLVIDIGTSVLTGTDLQLRQRLGELLPDNVAIDRWGKPTLLPDAAREGALLPFAGYKGFALALATHALGLLGGDSRAGYLFIAIKPDLFVSEDTYRRILAAEIARIKATPRQEGVVEIRIPGERATRERVRRLREGIEIDATVYDGLKRLAGTTSSAP